MLQFHWTYRNHEKVAPLVRQFSWTLNLSTPQFLELVGNMQKGWLGRMGSDGLFNSHVGTCNDEGHSMEI